jgi:hypothetical protein
MKNTLVTTNAFGKDADNRRFALGPQLRPVHPSRD